MNNFAPTFGVMRALLVVVTSAVTALINRVLNHRKIPPSYCNHDSFYRQLRLLRRELRAQSESVSAAMRRANSAYTAVSRLKGHDASRNGLDESAEDAPSEVAPSKTSYAGKSLTGLLKPRNLYRKGR